MSALRAFALRVCVPLVVMLAATSAPAGVHDAPVPFAPGQTWVGSYACAQGLTNLRLEITNVAGGQVDAVFAFDVATAGVVGRYAMNGTYDPAARRLALAPVAWIAQPPGYVMVGLDGVVSRNGRTYSGRVTHPSCRQFGVVLQ